MPSTSWPRCSLAKLAAGALLALALALAACAPAVAPAPTTLFLVGRRQVSALHPSDLTVAANLGLPAPAIAGVVDAPRHRLDLLVGGASPALLALPAAAPRLQRLARLDLAPRALALGRRGRRLYILGAAAGGARLQILDASTGASLRRQDFAGAPRGLALAPSGRILIATANPNALVIVGSHRNVPAQTITLGCQPRQLASLPYGHKAFVLCPQRLAVMDTAAPGLLTYLELGTHPRRMLLKPDGGELYVSNAGGTISIVNTADNEISGTLLAGVGADAMAVAPDGSTLYVANADAGTLSVISLAARTQLAMVRVGEHPVQLALAGDFVFAADAGSGDLAAVRNANDPNNPNTLVTLLPAPPQPALLAPVPRQ